MAPPRKPFKVHRPQTEAQEARVRERQQEAREHYEQAQAQRQEKRRRAIYNSKVVEERGIEDDLLTQMGWREVFEGRGWMKLTERPVPANLEIVREFYFNMDPKVLSEYEVVEVQGSRVDVSPEIINRYYGTPDIPECRFGLTRMVHLMKNADLLRRLCSPDHDKTADHTTLGDFCYEAHVWNLFASYSITPVGRRSGFTSERLQTLFSLQHGHAIDLGRFIFRQLEEHGKGAENRSLIFPSLITALCQAAGVDVGGPGARLTVPTVIDFKSVNYIRNLRKMPKLLNAKERAREERRTAASSSTQQSTASSSRPSTSSRRSASQSTELAELIRQNNATQQEMMATQQAMIVAQQEMMATMTRNRAEDQGTIMQLQETIARLEAKVQELQGKMMHGQTYQRRPRSRD